jgi:hypothetical protein
MPTISFEGMENEKIFKFDFHTDVMYSAGTANASTTQG